MVGMMHLVVDEMRMDVVGLVVQRDIVVQEEGVAAVADSSVFAAAILSAEELAPAIKSHIDHGIGASKQSEGRQRKYPHEFFRSRNGE